VIEKLHERNVEETAAAGDELPKLKAYLEAVGADPSLDEKEKMVRVQAVLFGPRRRKTQADGNGPPKKREVNRTMFAYVRLCSLNWRKNCRGAASGVQRPIRPDKAKILRTRSILSLAGSSARITFTPPSHHCVRGQL